MKKKLFIEHEGKKARLIFKGESIEEGDLFKGPDDEEASELGKILFGFVVRDCRSQSFPEGFYFRPVV